MLQKGLKMNGLINIAERRRPVDNDYQKLLRSWLDEGLQKPGRSGAELARLLRVSEPAMSSMRGRTRGKTKPRQIKIHELIQISNYFGENPPIPGIRIISQDTRNEEAQPRPIAPDDYDLIREFTRAEVAGTAQAGTYRAQEIANQDEPDILYVHRDKTYPNARHYVLDVVGDSMDLCGILDGDRVVFTDIRDTNIVTRKGDIVHVQRSISGGLVEWTIKEIDTDSSGKTILVPRSSNPRHKPIIPSGDPAVEEVKILGLFSHVYPRFAR